MTKNQVVRTTTSTSSGNRNRAERDQRRGERQQRQGQPREVEAAEGRAVVEPARPRVERADERREERDRDHRRDPRRDRVPAVAAQEHGDHRGRDEEEQRVARERRVAVLVGQWPRALRARRPRIVSPPA